MNVNQINNNQTDINFGKLKRITCSSRKVYGKPNNLEKRVKIELKQLAEKNSFFETNDVNAFILIKEGIALLQLKYRPIANSFGERIKNVFSNNKSQLNISEQSIYPEEGMFLLIKKMRKAVTEKDIFSLADKSAG